MRARGRCTRARWAPIGLALAFAACAPEARRAAPSPQRRGHDVRVGIAVGVSDVMLRSRGRWEGRAGGARWDVPPGSTLRCTVLLDRILIIDADGARHEDPSEIQFHPRDGDAMLEYTDVPYRGRFVLRRDAARLTLIEICDIETYLRGVVTWEIGPQANEVRAAVEAQAIAARTYTRSRLGQFEAQGFDLYPDERDQVYKGAARDDAVADRAIETTRGLVLEYQGTLIQAYYSSTCGGHTSWIEHVWPKPAAPYLQGQRDAPPNGSAFCIDSRLFRWTEAWSGAELERTLQESLPRVLRLPAQPPIGALLDLRIAERDVSARVLDLEVRTTSGTYHARGDAIRWVLKPRDRPLLRSLMFELDLERTRGAIVRVVARGGGNGHGVGMCQMGALGMARAGFDRNSILSHYYPGAAVRRAD